MVSIVRFLHTRRLACATLIIVGGFSAPFAAALTAPPTGDTYIDSSTAATKNANYGAKPTLNVGSGASTLIQFNLGALPPGTVDTDIDQASVIVFVNKVTTSGAISVLPVTTAWNEGTVTFNTALKTGSAIATETPVTSVDVIATETPVTSVDVIATETPVTSVDVEIFKAALTTGSAIATVPVPATALNQYLVIDVTAQVKAWVAGRAINNGLMLVPATDSPATVVLFDSKENGGRSPTLDITLAIEGPQGAKGDPGVPGTAGGAAATVSVGTVTTGAPGSSAQVTNSGTSSAAVLNFVIPQGPKGDKGDPGTNGTSGAPVASGGSDDAFASTSTQGSSIVIGTDSVHLTTLAQLTLDPGNYLVSGKARVDQELASSPCPICSLQVRDNTGKLIASPDMVNLNPTFFGVCVPQTVVLQAPIIAATRVTVTMGCYLEYANYVVANWPQMFAIRTGHLTMQ